jgi:hypothetical protein
MSAKRFILNLGVTGRNGKFGNGILEYRVGDTVVMTRDERKKKIKALTPRQPEKIGSPCHVQFTDGTACCVTMICPANPNRIEFGVVLVTGEWRPWRNQTGSACRYPTHLEMEQEVARLREVGYQGKIEVFTEEPYN